MERLTLDAVRLRGHDKGFVLVSSVYVNTKTKLRWVCGGHVFVSKFNAIDQGDGCRFCWAVRCGIERRQDVSVLHALAHRHGGEFLSERTYVNCMTKVSWRCASGHTFNASANRVQQGDWCSKCSGNGKKDLDHCNAMAARRGGVCLSSEYTNAITKLTWQCDKGHVWNTMPTVIFNGRWCPTCGKARDGFERDIFEMFRSHFPDAVRAVKGILPNRRFELDVYIPSIRVAVECDGEQWHRTDEAKSRDRRKEQECKDVGIALFRIGYRASNRCRGERYAQAKAELLAKVLSCVQDDTQEQKAA